MRKPIPLWLFLIGVGVAAGLWRKSPRAGRRSRPPLSGPVRAGCRDAQGRFVPVPQCTRRRPKKAPRPKLLPLARLAKNFLDITEKQYMTAPEMAGAKMENVLSMAQRIALLAEADEVMVEHVAEAMHYGGDMNVYIGHTLWGLVMATRNRKISKSLVDTALGAKADPHYERLKQVAGVDPRPAIRAEVERYNRMAEKPGMDRHLMVADIWRRQAAGEFAKLPKLVSKARPKTRQGKGGS